MSTRPDIRCIAQKHHPPLAPALFLLKIISYYKTVMQHNIQSSNPDDSRRQHHYYRDTTFVSELFKHWTFQTFAPGTLLRTKYNAFNQLLRLDEICLDCIADLEEIHYGHEQTDWARVVWLTEELAKNIRKLIDRLQIMSPVKYMDLHDYTTKLNFYVRMGVCVEDPVITPPFVFGLNEAFNRPDAVGEKAANLAGIAAETDISILPARVISAHTFHYFIEVNDLRGQLDDLLCAVSLTSPAALDRLSNEMQQLIMKADIPAPIANEIEIAALELGQNQTKLAVRSSVVTENSAVSFAGQYETVLNVSHDNILTAWKQVIASKYTSRAISYRIRHGLADTETPLAVLIMPMVNAACSGTAYSPVPSEQPQPLKEPSVAVHSDNKNEDKSSSGTASTQSVFLSKTGQPALIRTSDKLDLPVQTITQLATQAVTLEKHLKKPCEIEWITDRNNNSFIIQSRAVSKRQTEKVTGSLKDTGVPPRLGIVLPRIAKLTMLDSSAKTFTPANCRSLHDLVRFVYEKGVEEMFSLAGQSSHGLSGARKLRTHLPISMHLLNLDGGFFHSATGKNEIGQSDIASVPMWAFWVGLSSALTAWHNELPQFNWKNCNKAAAGIISKDSPLLSSYAVISDKYIHAMMRFGFHSSTVDCFCSDSGEQNYIRFRFISGGDKSDQRTLKLDVVERILTAHSFSIKRKGNMLTAQCNIEMEHIIQQDLALLGLLLAKIRIMDIKHCCNAIDVFEKDFLYDFKNLTY